MNKGQLVEALAGRAGITKKAAEAAVVGLFGGSGQVGLIADTVASGEKVELVGFGNFSKVKREARKGRNPQTGEEVDIAATHIPKFKPGRIFKGAMN